MERDESVGEMPMKLAAEGVEGGALGRASRGDLAQGFTKLDEVDSPDTVSGDVVPHTPTFEDGPTNEIFTEHDAGGFCARPHGLER